MLLRNVYNAMLRFINPDWLKIEPLGKTLGMPENRKIIDEEIKRMRSCGQTESWVTITTRQGKSEQVRIRTFVSDYYL